MRFLSCVLIASFISTMTFAAAPLNTPVGFWRTKDDVSGKPKSIIEIWKTSDQELMGKVVKIFPKQGMAQAKLCTACQGDKHNQPMVGLVIISGVKAKKNQWDNGEIIDPENGKKYSVSMHLADNGKKLNVHGYIGLPLLGRSQTWERIDLLSEDPQK